MNIKNEFDILNNCPICNSNKLQILLKTNTMHPSSDILIDLIECNNCQHWFINPMPQQTILNEFYSTQSEYVVPRGYVGTQDTNEEHSYLKIIFDKISNGNKYIELGVGSGHLFNQVKLRNSQGITVGIEPAPWHEDSNIFKSIDEVTSNDFDFATSFDVLEHLKSPLLMTSKLSSLLKSGGTLMLSFPNKDSLIAKAQQKKWSMFSPFGHLHYFSYKSVQIMLNKSGLDLIAIRRMRPGNMTTMQSIKIALKSKNFIKFFIRITLLGKDQWFVEARKK